MAAVPGVTADRILALAWERNRDHGYSRAVLMREYLRRAAVCVRGEQPAGWPFFDVAATLDPDVRADSGLVNDVVDAVRRAGEIPLIIATCAAALHFSALVSVHGPNLDLPNPFEPLLTMYERGVLHHQ